MHTLRYPSRNRSSFVKSESSNAKDSYKIIATSGDDYASTPTASHCPGPAWHRQHQFNEYWAGSVEIGDGSFTEEMKKSKAA